MRSFSSFSNTNLQSVKAMDVEQFEQVVKAIVEGRYSWACVLILRFAGYNPAHYIPYRTYKRLVKDNKQIKVVAPDKPIEASGERDLARTDRVSTSSGMY